MTTSQETQTTEAPAIDFSQPLDFLGQKVVSSGYIQSLMNAYQEDGITIPGNSQTPLKSVLKLEIPGTIETNVVILGYRVTPFGTRIDVALQIHDDVFVLLDDIPYNTDLLKKDLPTDSE